MANVFEAGGAEEGIGDGVREDVGVGVAEEPPLEGYLHPAKNELSPRAVLREGVDIDAQTHPEGCLGAANVRLLLRAPGLLQDSAAYPVTGTCTGREDGFGED